MTFVRFTNEEIDEMRRANRPYPASGVFLEEENGFIDGYGQFVGNLHPASACADRDSCVIHRQSDHNMRAFQLRWRTAQVYDIKPSHFERICPHGIGHPDPDDMGYWRSVGEESMGVHGCDGCCGKSADENWERVVKP